MFTRYGARPIKKTYKIYVTAKTKLDFDFVEVDVAAVSGLKNRISEHSRNFVILLAEVYRDFSP
ncbi:MAG: hypothetical protein JOY71_00095 [Acetobacteraceae bacterium]|nr:hypothetical protein [Acetobacteraceae bacterium]